MAAVDTGLKTAGDRNIRTLLGEGVAILTDAGVGCGPRETPAMLAHALSCSVPDLYLDADRFVAVPEQQAFLRLVAARASGRPLQYVLGSQGFRYLHIEVRPSVFIPRPETEVLVDAALEWLGGKPSMRTGPVVDMGTGSGAIALSLAQELPELEVIGVDISREALRVADENARANGLESQVTFLQSDGLSGLDERLEGTVPLIVSNPPYVSASEWQDLAPELRFEPDVALCGGTDGLHFYRRLASEAPKFLRPKGALIVEVGRGQAALVVEILTAGGPFGQSRTINDLSGADRVVQVIL